jgi:ankyrin repeat protein
LEAWLKDSAHIKTALARSRTSQLPNRAPRKRGIPRNLDKLIEYYSSNPDEKIRAKIFQKIHLIENPDEASRETGYKLPLSLVAEYGLLEEVEYLLQRGANPDGQSEIYGIGGKAFNAACCNGHTQVCDVLLNSGASMFAEITIDENGIRYYLEAHNISHSKPKLHTHRYCLALFFAASSGSPESIDYLISKGADVFQLDLNGDTLIHKSCLSGNAATLKHLIRLGLDVDAATTNNGIRGETALHYAVRGGFVEAARILLENGANPNVVDCFIGENHSWKNTPLDLMEENVESKLYKLLRAHGALSAEEVLS